jgi:hypothetical protein
VSLSRRDKSKKGEGTEGPGGILRVPKEETPKWGEATERKPILGGLNRGGTCRVKAEAVIPILVTLACPPGVASQGLIRIDRIGGRCRLVSY